jgi:hypothetical protein
MKSIKSRLTEWSSSGRTDYILSFYGSALNEKIYFKK